MFFPSGFRGPAASGSEVHIPTTRTNLVHQRPDPMASVPTGGPPPCLSCCCDSRSSSSSSSSSKQHLLLQHLPAAAVPAAVTKAAVRTPAIDLSSEESKDNTTSGLSAGVSHAAAAVLIPGSTTIHTKVNVAATFGQKMSPVWAYSTKFSPAVPSGPSRGKNAKCWLRRGDGQECPLYTQNGTKALIRHLHKRHEADWKLVLVARSS